MTEPAARTPAARRPVRWLVLAVLAGLFGWAVWGLAVGSPHAQAGKPAPAFTLLNLQGRPVSLASFRGHLVVLNFWATWCQPCQQEIPQLIQLQRQAGTALRVVGVDRMEPANEVATYVKRAGIDYPVLLDSSGHVSAIYGVTGQPESFWISPSGVLLLHVPGPMTPSDMQRFFSAFAGVS
jgi:cytochrome c biogenesis protein CcmG/thiol:disulfide interchange protein DsbE